MLENWKVEYYRKSNNIIEKIKIMKQENDSTVYTTPLALIVSGKKVCSEEDIPISIHHEVPTKLYRYFTDKEHRDNFLNGNVWFAGKNKNRFFRGPYIHILNNRDDTLSFTTGDTIYLYLFEGNVWYRRGDRNKKLPSTDQSKCREILSNYFNEIKKAPSNKQEIEYRYQYELAQMLNESPNDPYEYYYQRNEDSNTFSTSFMSSGTLSFCREYKPNGKYWIEVDTPEFVNCIKESIINSEKKENRHEVTWLDKEYLLSRSEKFGGGKPFGTEFVRGIDAPVPFLYSMSSPPGNTMIKCLHNRPGYIFTPDAMFAFNDEIIEIEISTAKLIELKEKLNITNYCVSRKPRALSDQQVKDITSFSGHTYKDVELSLNVYAIRCFNLCYMYKDQTPINNCDLPRIAFSKDKTFVDEQETRLEFSTSDLLGNKSGLLNLVEYLKLSNVNIKNCCREL